MRHYMCCSHQNDDALAVLLSPLTWKRNEHVEAARDEIKKGKALCYDEEMSSDRVIEYRSRGKHKTAIIMKQLRSLSVSKERALKQKMERAHRLNYRFSPFIMSWGFDVYRFLNCCMTHPTQVSAERVKSEASSRNNWRQERGDPFPITFLLQYILL